MSEQVIDLSETLLTVQRESRDDALVLRFEGQVDILSAPKMRTELDAAITEADETLVADLTGLTFLGSVGIAELMRVQQQSDAGNIHFVVVAPQFIRRLLDLTGVSSTLDVRATEGDVRA
ncbi:STAS domain-containing protein [Labedaea rhizosphaerae]|uniref:STAS domain-containing protein n=1 Tax=Labedaea rhizosphaerae TaxID=598644 RepID=UPI0014150740|nr:STAS domain-containing protein [Labedaea rhizosphaerae]